MSGFRDFLENFRVNRGLPDSKVGTVIKIEDSLGEELLPRGTSRQDITKNVLGRRGMVRVQVVGPGGHGVKDGESLFYVYGDNCANPVKIRDEWVDTSRKIKLHK